MTKKIWKSEINDALQMIIDNDRHMEDCATFVKTLTDNEVEVLIKKIQSQHGWDFTEAFDMTEKRTKLKIALFAGYVPCV